MSDDNGPDAGFGRMGDRTVSSGARFDLPGLEEATKQVEALNKAITALSDNLKGISSSQGQHTSGIQAIGSAVQNMSGGTGSSGYIPGANYKNTGATAGSQDMSWLSGQISQMGSNPLQALGMAATLPITYAFNRVEQNRATTRDLSYDLSRPSTMSGTSIEGILKMLSNQVPVLGSAEDITQAMNIGASGGFFNMNSPRSGAFYSGVRQMQQFQPGVSAPQAATQMLGALDPKQQQISMMLTGGAMGMAGAGGVPKTLSEWAESTLRWFEAQRPGAQRGKAFTKEELASQVFPGSNMNAWFSSTGVQPYMQDYFWQYAMGKVQSGGTTQTKMTVDQIVGQRGGDLGLATLQTSTANARRDFTMASTPGAIGGQSFYQAYLTRESADRDFTNVMSQLIDKSLASMMSGVLGQIFAKIPTPIAGMLGQMVTSLPELITGGFGDPEAMIGDAGSYGPLGGTGTAGMTPSMATRVNAMMRANPNVRINSGFRDGGLQGRLHAKGVGMTAPAGQSMHGRGLAADLGPASQLGWISANASKFGLESGMKAGEPWHVGMPGTIPGGNFMIGDVGDWLSDIWGFGKRLVGGVKNTASGLSDLFSSLTSGGSSQDFAVALAHLLLGGGGGGGGGGGAGGGGAVAGGGGTPGPVTPAAPAASASSVAAIQSRFFKGMHPKQANVSSHTAAIIAALQAAQGAGFSGDSLVAWGAIAGGESVWNPGRHNLNARTGDDSYGLWQINMTNAAGGPGRRVKYGLAANKSQDSRLLDPTLNAHAAWDVSGGGKNSVPWTGSLSNDAMYVQGVYDIAKSHGFIGDPGYSPAYHPFGNGSATQINVTNAISVQGGSNSPADLRRTAEQLAQFTTGEVRKQMARSS